MTEKELSLINFLKQRQEARKLENFLTILEEFSNKSIYCSGYPAWLTIDPTNICTLKCPFCPTGYGLMKRPKGMMSKDRFQRIMDVLGPYLLHIDMQNWGEPLLNKDIYQMISYAKKFDINITVSTNFQNFDEKSAEELVNSGLDRIVLSIDGASQQTYEKYRRGGSFLKAIENARVLVNKKRQLKSSQPFVLWQFLVFRHNEHEIEVAKAMGRDLGVDAVGITPAFVAVDSDEYKDWVALNSQYNRYDLINKPKEVSGSESFLKAPEESFCNWPWEGITINWDGSVAPCCGIYLEEEDFGNIFTGQDFHHLWNNNHYKAAREFIRSRKKPNAGIKNTCVNCTKIGQINVELSCDFCIKS
ncbi:MAG: radical SAM protein [Candidatus Omnitrophica bacterium]|nr:radical SAM protein [Candidatus Omnitrophota bacterium]